MSRRTYAAVGTIALIVAVALIAASLIGARGGGPAAQAEQLSVNDASTLLRGIPQSGPSLGRPTAPVTLVEFADPQCPYCAQWSQQAFPELVRDYVRPGKVRVVFAGLAFIGPDSDEALRFAFAAGRQGKLWEVVDLLYANQGAENSDWVSEDFLREVGDAVPGLDVERALRETSSPEVESELAAAKDLQARLGVDSTPAFAAARKGGKLSPVQITSLDAGGIRPSLDGLLAR
jgi:protein-disulfide isomerase